MSLKARENKLLVLTSDLYSAINSHLPHLEESYCALKSSTNAALFDDLLREITHSTQAMEEIYCQRVDLSGGAVDVDVTNVYESYLEEINHLRQLVSNVKEQLEEDELSSIEQEIEQTKKKLAEQMSLFNTRRKIKNEKLHDNPQHDAKCIMSILKVDSYLPSVQKHQQAAKNSDAGVNVMKEFSDALISSIDRVSTKSVEPPEFSGDVLEFADWEVDLDIYLRDEHIDGKDRLQPLQKFVGDEAKACIIGLL